MPGSFPHKACWAWVLAGEGWIAHAALKANAPMESVGMPKDMFEPIIPEDVRYLIPAALLLGAQRKTGLTLFPLVPLKKDRYL